MVGIVRSGTLVREARERVGLTQAALAQRAGTTQSAIARIETGGEPTLARLEELLAACGVSMQVHLARFEGSDAREVRRWIPTDAVSAIVDHGVAIVVSGRAAAALLGVATEVEVPLVVPDTGRPGLERLSSTLEALHARRRTTDGAGTLPMDRAPANLLTHRRWELATSHGAIDVDFEPPGTRGYADLSRRALTVDGVVVSSPADTARVLDAAGDDLAIVTALRAAAG